MAIALKAANPCTMGCTSSAPNMVATHVNTTEKNLQFPEESHESSFAETDVIIHTDDGNEKNEIKVLPSCDTLDESIRELDRNNKSVTNITNMEMVNDKHPNGYILENHDVVPIRRDEEDKLSSMPEVVEKVVELYGTENPCEHIQNSSDDKNEIDEATTPSKSEEEHNRTDEEPLDVHKSESTKHIDEKLEEAISPTQSTSSRATRWEALADIAAELPPTLTVDPITGQIYSLTK